MAESLDNRHETSDDFNNHYCDICYEAKNINVRPEGYCHECYQCLCKDCLVVHRRLLSTKDHVIHTGQDMPRSQTDKPPRFEHCRIHKSHWKNLYCNEHRVLLCSLCVPLHHKDCRVENVERATKSIPSSEIDILYNSVSNFKTQLLSAESRIQSNVSDLIKQKNNILKEIQEIYDKTMSEVIKLFLDIKSELESKYQYQSSFLTCDQKNIKDSILSLDSNLDELSSLKGRTIDTKVFLKIQDVLKNIDKCKMNVSTLNQTTTRRLLNFVPDETMNNFLSSSFTMGMVSLKESNHDFTISVPEIMFPSFPTKLSQASGGRHQPSGTTKPISEIKVQHHTRYKLPDDEYLFGCWISGLSITQDGRRLLVDSSNRKIKMLSRDMKIISTMSMQDAPWDIAVTGDRVAVVSGFRRLVILDVSGKQMFVRRTVKLPFEVYGIATYKDKLVITSPVPSPASVKLIDKSGKVYWSTSTDQLGQKLFSWPLYAICCHGGRSSAVIVTDELSNTLTLLNSNTGDVIKRHNVWKTPRGVTTDTAGNIYVCCFYTKEVAVLAKDFSEEKIILTPRDGISGEPEAIIYDAENHHLLVSYSMGCKTFDCFQLL